MLGHSIVSQHFMEPGCSIPNSQQLYLFLSLARPIQSTSPHPTSPRSILILHTHLRFGLPCGLFPSGFPTIIYKRSSSPIRTTWPAHLILRDLIILIILGEKYKSRSSSLCITDLTFLWKLKWFPLLFFLNNWEYLLQNQNLLVQNSSPFILLRKYVNP
jgi:hypothetical protein